MKKYTMYTLLLLCLIGCDKIKKPNDLKNCVILNKEQSRAYGFCEYVTYFNLTDSIRRSNCIDKFYSNKWNVGDTIK